MKSPRRFLLPLFLLFVIVGLAVFLLGSFLEKNHISALVLQGANLLLFVVAILSFFIQRKGLHNKNPNVFVRSVMGSMMIKMLFCVVAVIIYVYISGDGFNKRAVFISLFLYLVYLAVEVRAVMKMNMNKKTYG